MPPETKQDPTVPSFSENDLYEGQTLNLGGFLQSFCIKLWYSRLKATI